MTSLPSYSEFPANVLVLRIVICHRGVFRSTADRQQRKKLFAHRASRLGKRYGQIWIGLVDGAADRKRFLARLELVLRCGLADQRDLYSDGMITRVRRIEGLLGGKSVPSVSSNVFVPSVNCGVPNETMLPSVVPS